MRDADLDAMVEAHPLITREGSVQENQKYHSVKTHDEDSVVKDDELADSTTWSDGPSNRPSYLRSNALRCSTVVFLGILAIAFVFNWMFGMSKNSKSGDSTTYTVSFQNSYPAIVDNYPWSNIVEPHVETTVSVSGLADLNDQTCEWAISSEGSLETYTQDGCGNITFTFTDCPKLFSVRVLVGSTEVVETAMCKYVRREIRVLSEKDRTRYFSALELVHRLDLDAGIALYGAGFKNYQYFTAKHLHVTNVNDCFPFVGPFHGSNGFITSHAAFTLELEMALQSIDPALTQPYWDFTYDADAYGNRWWRTSDIVSYDFFGPLESGGPNHVLNSSRWFAYIPVATTSGPNTTDVVLNAFGVLTNPFNTDGTPYVTRGASSICDLEATDEMALPSSSAVAACQALRPQGLTAWRECFEEKVHAYVHSQVGGGWDCPVDVGAWTDSSAFNAGMGDPLATARATFLALNAVDLWKVALSSGLLVCPDACSADASFSECRCQCWGAVGERSSLTAEQVYELLDASRVLEYLLLPMGASRYLARSGGRNGRISFEGLSMLDNNVALRRLLDLVCSPGKVGPMATDAAANDPLFWALHLEYDRLWHEARLAGDLGLDGWEEDSSACPGGNPSDTMPFSVLSATGGSESDPTNSELYEFFSPSNDDLPYVYDSFAPYQPSADFF